MASEAVTSIGTGSDLPKRLDRCPSILDGKEASARPDHLDTPRSRRPPPSEQPLFFHLARITSLQRPRLAMDCCSPRI